MKFGHLNNFETQLGAALGSGATSLQIVSGAANLHGATANLQYALTLCERDIRGRDIRREVVYVTARSDNTLTVIRGREGTSGHESWPVGTPVEARTTAGVLASFRAQDDITDAIGSHAAASDPHPQYLRGIAGDLRRVALATEPLDLMDNTASAAVSAPAGTLLFIESLDLVVTAADAASGSPEISAGPSAESPSSYLSGAGVSGRSLGERDIFPVLVDAGVSSVYVRTAVAATGTTLIGRAVVRGYLMEM